VTRQFHGFANRADPDSFIRLVRSTLLVEFLHPLTAGVMQGNQLPLRVENRAAGTAAFGRGAIVNSRTLVVEQIVD